MTNQGFRASILVFTYNQEAFVRAAVACAFAQDCEGLEIILSDDCSTDGTYQIMSEMAASYAGPHTVRLNQNAQNLGVNNHINHLVGMASADICVPFPGDDISVPHRVSRLVEAMERDDVLLVHSDATSMDAAGNSTDAWHRNALFYRSTDPVLAAASDRLYLGATAAYRRELFNKFGPLPEYSKAFEDLITGFRAALEGRVGFVDEELVRYRNDVGISNANNSYRLATRAAASARRHQLAVARQAIMAQRQKDARTHGLGDDHPISQVLIREYAEAKRRVGFFENSIMKFLRTHGAKGVNTMASELNYILRRK